jgi:hypothetical protein
VFSLAISAVHGHYNMAFPGWSKADGEAPLFQLFLAEGVVLVTGKLKLSSKEEDFVTQRDFL